MTRFERARYALALLALAPAVLVVTIGADQQQQGRGRGGFQNYFTGDISVMDSSDMRMSRIRFEAGAGPTGTCTRSGRSCWPKRGTAGGRSRAAR